MNYLIHPTYVDPATSRFIMTADPLQLTCSVTSAIRPGDASTSFDLPETTYVNTYIPPPVAPFSGDPSLLVIDIAKVPELKVKANRALDETSSPLLVPGGEFDAIDMVNQENMNPQANIPRGSKRKATSLEEEEEEEDNVPVPSTKRKIRVLKTQKENKKATEKADNSGVNEKSFKCPQCGHLSKRRSNLNAHMKTHESNRIKEFVCPQCSKGFTRKHDRNRHVANVHT